MRATRQWFRATAAASLAPAVAFSPSVPNLPYANLPVRRSIPVSLVAGCALGRHSSRLFLSSSANDQNDRRNEGATDGFDKVDTDVHFDGNYEDNETLDHVYDVRDNKDQSDEESSSPVSTLCDGISSSIEQALAAAERKGKSLRSELEKAKGLEDTTNRANLIVSNLYRLPPGIESAVVEDWEHGGTKIDLVLDTAKFSSAQEESDALFSAARKIKRGSKMVEILLKDLAEAEQILIEAKQDLAAAMAGPTDCGNVGMVTLIQERLERTSSKTGFKAPRLNDKKIVGGKERDRRLQERHNQQAKRSTRYQPTFRELTSPDGLRILVGRNRRDNEAISFQAARGEDVWMHARGCPGAHVLLKVQKGGPRPTDADLQFAADLAAFYSDARTERRAAVTTAEPRHIQKPRGAPPGAIKLRKEGRTLMGRPEDVPEVRYLVWWLVHDSL